MKRLFDILFSAVGLMIFFIPSLIVAIAIWCQDFKSPFYIASRAAKKSGTFDMVKFRSMIVRADQSGVDSTASNDPRITIIGKLVRKCKFDEIPQLWNVLSGQMSFVGPRPNVVSETRMYTSEEQELLSVRPGITDFSSIVFSDEGEILKGSENPDLLYNQIIRPWKSRLGLLYVEKRTLLVDIYTILLTLVAAVNRELALRKLSNLVTSLGAPQELVDVVSRKNKLEAVPPPGAAEIVQMRITHPSGV